MSFLRMSASHSEGNDFDFFETLETTGPLSYARCQVKEADQRLQSSPSNFIVLMITSSSAGKEPTSNAGDPGSISASGRSPGEGIGYPLQCSGLENSMDCIVHGVTKSWTRLSNFHIYTFEMCM